MLINYKNLTIRNAAVSDAVLLCGWWNDGKVMAHAGFPNGLGTTPEKIAQDLLKDTDQTYRRLIIELDGAPVGEMSYGISGSAAEIGIKICDFSRQDKGLGKIFLSMLISALFDSGVSKIVLDTNLKNLRAQHVYESLGFSKVRTNLNAWKDRLGVCQSSIDYELAKENFVNFAL